jgi:hypothetical protein
MDATFRPKLLDLVEFPATLIGDEAAGTAQGTVVEDFGTALLVEVSVGFSPVSREFNRCTAAEPWNRPD